MIGRWSQLVEAAAMASEIFGDDELEAYAEANPPLDAQVDEARDAYIEAVGLAAALPVILRQPDELIRYGGLGWAPVSSDRRYIGAKTRFQTHLLMRRYRVSL